jgi:hypothetical protein
MICVGWSAIALLAAVIVYVGLVMLQRPNGASIEFRSAAMQSGQWGIM